MDAFLSLLLVGVILASLLLPHAPDPRTWLAHLSDRFGGRKHLYHETQRDKFGRPLRYKARPEDLKQLEELKRWLRKK